MIHDTLTFERLIRAPRERVYACWTQLEHRRQWFHGPKGWSDIQRSLDLREGGSEILHGRFENGMESVYQARFHRIEPGIRLIYAFDMIFGGRPLSVSLSGVSFEDRPEGSGLVYIEDIFFLAPDADVAERSAGTGMLLDRFVAYVEKSSV